MFLSEEKYGPRLSVSLCHCSSEDTAYPGRALRLHTRNTTGWQSSKTCAYPQELGFVFEGEVELQYIRVLSHESKIPSRIEVFLAQATEEEIQSGTVKPYASSTFYRLGYVDFSPGTNHKYGVRELKTINIRRNCIYVKLLILRPHRSDYNVFNQVGIVALTTHGTFLRASRASLTKGICVVGETVEIPLDEMLPPRLEGLQTMQTENDDSGTEIDPMTSRRIAEIAQMKERAVAAEDYDLAARLKACLNFLERAGKELCNLEKLKALAVKEENYILAKDLKSRIDRFREEAYKIPKTLPNEMDGGAVSLEKQLQLIHEPGLTKEEEEKEEVSSPVEPVISSSGVLDEVPVKDSGRYALEEADDATGNEEKQLGHPARDLSAIMEGREEWEQTINRIILQFSGEQLQAPPLQGKVLAEARDTEKAFGIYCAACLFGKTASLREAAIRAVVSSEGFAALSVHSQVVIETLLLYMALPSRGVSDSAAVVVLACCEALQAIIKGSIQGAPSVSLLLSYLRSLLQGLLFRLGDSNNRIRDMVESVLMSLSTVTLEHVVSVLLMDVDKIKKRPVSYKLHLARMNMLTALVERHGLNGDGSASLETDTIVSKAVAPCLQHSNAEVRESAGHLFAKLLLAAPTHVAPYMRSLKPAQQNLIEQHVKRLKMTALGAMGQMDVESSATFLSDTASQSSPVDCAAQRFQQRSDGPGDQSVAITCQFCGETNECFSEAALDIHFIRACPMLCPCPLCDQVTEIATLQQHLTTECESRHLVRECPICKEAVKVEDIKKHIASKRCIRAVPTHSVCPLCHARFQAGKTGWVEHLALSPGCPNNPRKYDGSGPIGE